MDGQLQAQIPNQMQNQMQTPMSAQMQGHLSGQISSQLPTQLTPQLAPSRGLEAVNQEESTPGYEPWKGDCFYSLFYLHEGIVFGEPCCIVDQTLCFVVWSIFMHQHFFFS